MSTQRKIAEAIVRQYAQGLSELNLDLIAPMLHSQFKFVYRIAMSGVRIIAPAERIFDLIEEHGRGHGIRTDVRYIGHLYRTFLQIKKEGVTRINTGFFYQEIDGEQILCIKLLPPHDRRIIFPMDTRLLEEMKGDIPSGDAFLLPRVKHGLLCKVECYPSMKVFDYHVNGTFNRGVLKHS